MISEINIEKHLSLLVDNDARGSLFVRIGKGHSFVKVIRDDSELTGNHLFAAFVDGSPEFGIIIHNDGETFGERLYGPVLLQCLCQVLQFVE